MSLSKHFVKIEHVNKNEKTLRNIRQLQTSKISRYKFLTNQVTKHAFIANKKTFRRILICERNYKLQNMMSLQNILTKLKHASMNQKFANKHNVTNYTKNNSFRSTKLK